MHMIVRLGTQRLRRDRLELPLWLVGGVLLAMSGASAVASSYGDHAERAALLKTVAANPVILLFRGLPSGPGEAEFVLFLLLPWLVLVAALMSMFLAVRHTRADEESGRAALIAATRAGTRGPLTATLAYGVLINAVFGVLVMAVYLASGYPLPGSLIAGAACAISGAAFLTIALLAAQIARTSRGATSTGVWLALIALLVSGIGNALGQPDATLMRREPSWVTWLSPVGWAELTRPFADNDWRPLLLSAALALAAGAGAYAFNAKRDLEEGLWPQKHGRSEAGALLRSHPTLVWRLSRGSILGWAAGR